jgi:hypothetical protein
MPDPIWLDTNIVARVANGDQALEAVLQLHRADGHELLLVPKANDELLYGNPLTMDGRPVTEQQPYPARRVQIELTKARLGITVDMRAAELPSKTRVGYAMQDHVKRPKNMAVPASLSAISESDSLVLSQIKGSAQVRGVARPVMMTAETGGKGMISQAHIYNVTVVKPPPSPNSPTPPTPPPTSGGTSGIPGKSSLSPGAKSGSGTPTSPRTGSPSATIRSLPGAIGRIAVNAGLQLLITYLAEKVMGNIEKDIIEKRMKEFVPETQNFVTVYRSMILEMLISGKRPYVTSRVRVAYMMHGAQSGTEPTYIRSLPLVHLDSLWISDKTHDGESKHSLDTYIGGWTDVYDYTFSVSVGEQISQEELALYRDANAQITLYQTILSNGINLTKLGRQEIIREIGEMADAIRDTFGSCKSSDLKLNQNLWTKDGYKSVTGTMPGGVVY